MSTEHSVPRRRLYLVRHAQVRYFSADNKGQGPDEAALTDIGIEQAKRVGSCLQDCRFDRVFSSPVSRCQKTLSFLMAGREHSPQIVEALREAQPSALESLSAEAIRTGLLNAFEADAFLGGETYSNLMQRADLALQTLLSESWQSALVVAHEMINRAVLARLMHSDHQLFKHLEQDECCINIIDFDERGNGFLRLLNYCAYEPLATSLYSRSLERVYQNYLEIYGE